MVSSCLFGQTGPQRMYPGFGGQGSAIAGFNHLTGWPDREAVGPAGTITDSLSPRYVALLIAAALFHRERTGEGQYIDVSQIETGVYSLSEAIVRASARGEVMTRRGNHAEDAAPHAIYPCAGEDRWIAIAVFSDEEWRRLCAALGARELAADPRFATLAGRLAHEDALDAALAERTRAHEACALMHRLQAAGVEAGVVQTCDDLLRDPQLAHRGHFVRLAHRHLGELALRALRDPLLGEPAPHRDARSGSGRAHRARARRGRLRRGRDPRRSPRRGSSRERRLSGMRRRAASRAVWVLVGCVVCQMGLGFSYVFTTFLKPIVAELGWTRTAFSAAGGPLLLSMALAAPLIGNLSDRFGPRRVLAVSTAAARGGARELRRDAEPHALLCDEPAVRPRAHGARRHPRRRRRVALVREEPRARARRSSTSGRTSAARWCRSPRRRSLRGPRGA